MQFLSESEKSKVNGVRFKKGRAKFVWGGRMGDSVLCCLEWEEGQKLFEVGGWGIPCYGMLERLQGIV